MPDEPRKLEEAEAMRLLVNMEDAAPSPHEDEAPVESLGRFLESRRHALGWTSRRLAFALGVPEKQLAAWKADAALPDADGVFALCRGLEISPLRLLPMVRESARHVLRETLAQAAGRRRVMAARRRGSATSEADRVLVENLPEPLRAGLAARLGCVGDDVTALAAELRRLAHADATAQEVFVDGMAAALALEGEDDLPDFEA